MKVYRIENSEGVGPYRTDEFMDLLDEMKNAHCDYSHPNLLEDGLEYVWNESYICAFDSMKKLVRWFSGYLELLISLGFTVKTYETNEYYYGLSGKQLIFIPNV